MPRNNIITENFKNAIIDYSYLLEKDYPHKAILKIIGDRYLLTGLQRSILFRGITKKQKAFNRKSKLIYEKKVNNKMLFIDCYNVIITIVSYLSGKFIFIGNDGFLRDTAEAHGKIQKTDILEKSLILLFEYLKTLNLKDAVFFLDSPVSNSKKFANKINKLLQKHGIRGRAEVVKSPDFVLIHTKEAICATSDSSIIDNKEEVFDLAHNTLNYHFNPDFFMLENFRN